MSDDSLPADKRMRLRYPGVCSECGRQLEARTEAHYDRVAKTVRCLVHERGSAPDPSPAPSPPVDVGIDHLAITPTGIHVIDAKKYDGRPTLKVEGGLFRPRVERLRVGGRDRTKLVDGVLRQVDVVRTLLADSVPVRGVLCFVEADWPLIGGAFATRGVAVLWPKRLYRQLAEAGPLDARAVDFVHRQLAAALPPA